MNRWYQIRRLRGAVFLILVGVLALLNQWRILSWDKSWPLFLIVAGVLALAERTAWTADVRDQQIAQSMGATPGYPRQPAPPAAGSYRPAPDAAQNSLVQTHPPASEPTRIPEDSREDR